MTENKIMKLENLLNEMDTCIEDMLMYFEKFPNEFTEGASKLINEMEEERTALEEVILSLEDD